MSELKQWERQKGNRFRLANNNFARASRFFVHFLTVVERLWRETAYIKWLKRLREGVSVKKMAYITLTGLAISLFIEASAGLATQKSTE